MLEWTVPHYSSRNAMAAMSVVQPIEIVAMVPADFSLLLLELDVLIVGLDAVTAFTRLKDFGAEFL